MLNIRSKSANKRVIFLFGPTGVGKTELLLRLDASRFAVINADSKQVYRHLDIGSAKPDSEVLSHIKHHLIDILDPWEQFTVGDFVKQADLAVAEIREEGKIPILCGGTAFYFKHFLFGLPTSPRSDAKTRARVDALAEEHGLTWCYQELERVDSISAQRIHPSDSYRIKRALEVYYKSGKPLSFYKLPSTIRAELEPCVIGLERPKEELEARIRQRVELMFEAGLVQEIETLRQLGASMAWPGIQGIGYREFFEQERTREEVIEKIKRNSQSYAKRQMTFFKRLPQVHWFHPQQEEEIQDHIERFLNA